MEGGREGIRLNTNIKERQEGGGSKVNVGRGGRRDDEQSRSEERNEEKQQSATLAQR